MGRVENPKETIALIRASGMRCGLAIKPGTPIQLVRPYLEHLDMVLVMTVEPGFGGQKMIPDCLEKVRILRQWSSTVDIQVDGGITLENLNDALEAGANVIVAGSLIFEARDPRQMIKDMRAIMEKQEL